MSTTFQTANDVLKEDYHGPLKEQLNNSVFLLSQIDSNTEDVVGRHAVCPIHIGRTTGVGARGLGNRTLPSAGNQSYTDVRIPLRHNYGRMELDGPVIKAMSSDRGAFVRAVDSESTGLKNDLQRDVNRQIHGTANGVIATCGTTSASTTVNLHADTTATQVRQLYNQGGMSADFGTTADFDTTASDVGIVGFDTSTPGAFTVTTDAAVTTVNGTTVISRAGNGGASDNSGNPGGQDGQYELTGLQALVDDTADIQTIDTSATVIWQSNVNGNSGTLRAVSENLVNKMIQDTEINSGRKIDLLLGNAPVTRALANQLEAQRRNVDNVELEAGFSGIKWSTLGEGMSSDTKTIALVWDQDSKEHSLYGLCTDDFVQYVGSDWEWMDEDGAVLSRVPNEDAYEATMFKYHELAIKQRNAHFRIDDIQHID